MKISAVIMASGLSKRFGENKLLYDFKGKPLIENVFIAVKDSFVDNVVVVTKYDEIVSLSKKYGFSHVKNEDRTDDLSVTIRLGVENVKDSDGIMLCVADQPFLTKSSIDHLCLTFRNFPNCICALSINGELGNPVIFPKTLFSELLHLPPFSRGKKVILAHKDILKSVEIKEKNELIDIDTKESL